MAAASAGSAALAGLAKELADLAGAGDPDPIDFLCTLLGGMVAAAGVYGLVRDQAHAGNPIRLSAPLAVLGLVLAVPVADSWLKSLRRTSVTYATTTPARCQLR